MILDRAFAKSLAEDPDDQLVIGTIRDWLIERGAESEAELLKKLWGLFHYWAASPEGSWLEVDCRRLIDKEIAASDQDKLTAVLQAEYREAALRAGRRYFAEHPGIARSKYAEVVFGAGARYGIHRRRVGVRKSVAKWVNVVVEIEAVNGLPVAVIWNSYSKPVARIKLRRQRPKGVAGGPEALLPRDAERVDN